MTNANDEPGGGDPHMPSEVLREALKGRHLAHDRPLFYLPTPGQELVLYVVPVQESEDREALQRVLVNFRDSAVAAQQPFVALPIHETERWRDELTSLGWPPERKVYEWDAPDGLRYLVQVSEDDDREMLNRVLVHLEAATRPGPEARAPLAVMEAAESWEERGRQAGAWDFSPSE